MLGDLFKILVEEPEKLTKVGLRLLNAVLAIIIAEWLYRYFFGPYVIMDLGEFKQWVKFILSGKILIVIACYLIVRYLIESAFSLVLYLFVVKFLCTRKLFKISRDEIKSWLKFFDFVRFDNKHKIPRPGKNITILYQIANSFKTEGESEVYNELKDSLLNNVLNLYLLFLIVYFSFFFNLFNNGIFIGALIFGFLNMIFFYVLFNNMIEYMKKEHIEILGRLDFINCYHIVHEVLAKHFIYIDNTKSRFGKGEYFECEGNLYALLIYPETKLPRIDKFESYIEKLDKQGRHLFFVVNKNSLLETSTFSEALETKYTLITYENLSDLSKQLEDKLVKRVLNR